MKAWQKVFLVIGALFVAAGLFTGMKFGWDYSPAGTYTVLNLDSHITDGGSAFTLIVETDSVNVQLYPTDDTFFVSVSGALTEERMSVTRLGDTVRIKEQPLNAFRRIFASKDAEVIVWLPTDWVGTATLTSDTGRIAVYNVSSPGSTVSITTSAGTDHVTDAVDVSLSSFQTLTVSAPNGCISLDGISASSVTADAPSGYIWAYDLTADTLSLTDSTGEVTPES